MVTNVQLEASKQIQILTKIMSLSQLEAQHLPRGQHDRVLDALKHLVQGPRLLLQT